MSNCRLALSSPIKINGTGAPRAKTRMNQQVTATIIFLACCILPVKSHAGAKTLKNEGVTIRYDVTEEGAAFEVERLYPEVRSELEAETGFKVSFSPVITVIGPHEDFEKLSQNPRVVAFAMPYENAIVIDNSKMKTDPFTLGITLKHELCHLLLHSYIRGGRLPRWLNEGYCQKASGGIAELMMYDGSSEIEKASLAGKLIGFGELDYGFPTDERQHKLAYEQSKSFVGYLETLGGEKRLLGVFTLLREGVSPEDAVSAVYGSSLGALSGDWRQSLRKNITWLAYVGNNIEAVLFALCGGLLAWAFFTMLARKKAYRDREEEEEAARDEDERDPL